MFTVFGMSITIWQLIEAIPSIIAAIKALDQVYVDLASQGHVTIGVPSVKPMLLAKAVAGAIATTSKYPHPLPFTPEEKAAFDRASAMS